MLFCHFLWRRDGVLVVDFDKDFFFAHNANVLFAFPFSRLSFPAFFGVYGRGYDPFF